MHRKKYCRTQTVKYSENFGIGARTNIVSFFLDKMDKMKKKQEFYLYYFVCFIDNKQIIKYIEK
jgi:hypothetical protein